MNFISAGPFHAGHGLLMDGTPMFLKDKGE